MKQKNICDFFPKLFKKILSLILIFSFSFLAPLTIYAQEASAMTVGTNAGYNSSIAGIVKSPTAIIASLTNLVNKLK